MRVLGAHILQDLERQLRGDEATVVRCWLGEARSAHWSCEADLLQRFPTALTHDPDFVLFKLDEGEACMLVRINYPLRLIRILNLAPMSEMVWPPATQRKNKGRA
jgi:hypothetical protein